MYKVQSIVRTPTVVNVHDQMHTTTEVVNKFTKKHFFKITNDSNLINLGLDWGEDQQKS